MSMTANKAFNKELKQLQIRQAANTLFLEKKYSAITMDEIAKQAGITKRTLYLYYPSKLALFIHVFDEHLQQLHQQITKAARKNLPVVEVITSVFEILYSFTKKNEKFMRLYWAMDSAEFDGLIPEELLERNKVWTKAMFEEVCKVIERGQQDGMMLDYQPELIMHLLSAINKGIFTHTNKESRFSIAHLDPDDLYRMSIKMMKAGLFGVKQRKTKA
jgi:TetR/AcrR family fatty acid metabolism transcriptional regulator